MKDEAFILENNRILSLFSWENEHEKLVVGFTTKNDGVSQGDYSSLNVGLHVNDHSETVIQNRKLVSESLNFPLEKWVCSEQTHGNKIKKVTMLDCGKGVKQYNTAINDTDGIYTNERDILLASYYADCVPIYFFAPKFGYIGLAHAGWKGTVLNISVNMIERWVDEGIDKNNIQIAIGPSIGKCCYIVDEAVITRVKLVLGDEAAYSYKEISKGQYALDLKEVNRRLVLKVGIASENIIVSTNCTCCEKDLFFSHRRDKGKTGRMMSYIGMRGE